MSKVFHGYVFKVKKKNLYKTNFSDRQIQEIYFQTLLIYTFNLKKVSKFSYVFVLSGYLLIQVTTLHKGNKMFYLIVFG